MGFWFSKPAQERRPLRQQIREDKKKLITVILVPVFVFLFIVIVCASIAVVAIQGKEEQEQYIKTSNRVPKAQGRSGRVIRYENTEEEKLPLWANFTEAEQFCEKINKRLVVVDQAAVEISVLNRIVTKEEKEDCSDGYWIGARRNMMLEWYLGDAEVEEINKFLPIFSSVLDISSENPHYTGCLRYSSPKGRLEPTECEKKSKCFICYNTSCDETKDKLENCFIPSFKSKTQSNSTYLSDNSSLNIEWLDVSQAWEECQERNLSLAAVSDNNKLKALKLMLEKEIPNECFINMTNQLSEFLVGGQHRHYLETTDEIPITYEMSRFNLQMSSSYDYCYKLSISESFRFISTERCTKRLCYICQNIAGPIENYTLNATHDLSVSFQKQMTPTFFEESSVE